MSDGGVEPDVARTGGISYLRVPAGDTRGEAGIRPYMYVERVDAALERIAAAGGAVVTEPYEEGTLWVATFRDPAGNVLGLWQQGPR